MLLFLQRLFRLPVTGKVQWFNKAKGFGFIILDSGDKAFVHCTDLKSGRLHYLKSNQRVKCKLVKTDKGLQAKEVMLEQKPDKH